MMVLKNMSHVKNDYLLQVRKLRQEAGVSFCKPPSLELGSKNLFKELYIELKPLERVDNQL